jgi:sterol desaturase/sphingolipid hydroxylase (fatty acid hydroxylase superfamily)
MAELNIFHELSFEKYFLIKNIGFLLAFVFGTVLQVLTPHHKSLIADFKNWRVNLSMAFMNTLLMSLLVGSVLLVFSNYVVSVGWGVLQWLHIPTVMQIILSVLILDFTAYIWHRTNHRWPFLWRFHAVHHSDINFDTSTAVRFHIGELLISFGVRLFVVGLFGLPIIGLLIFELIYQFFNIFEHGNIRLPFWLERVMGFVFVTPALHRKHHATNWRDLNSNYSTIFSFWDRFGKTFLDSASSEKFQVGLPSQVRDYTLSEVLIMPAKKM